MPRYKPTKIIQAFRLMIVQKQVHGKINFSNLGRKMKIAACTLNRWYREADEGSARNRFGKMWKRAKEDVTQEPKPKKVKRKVETPKTNEQLLREENRYLRWVNEGYRLGWVDRLMGEYLKGD